MPLKGYEYVKIDPDKLDKRARDVYLVNPTFAPTTWPKEDSPATGESEKDDQAWYEVRFYARNMYVAYKTPEQFMDAIHSELLRAFPANLSELTITRYKPQKQGNDMWDQSYPGRWRYRPPYGPTRPEKYSEDNWRMVEAIHKTIEDGGTMHAVSDDYREHRTGGGGG